MEIFVAITQKGLVAVVGQIVGIKNMTEKKYLLFAMRADMTLENVLEMLKNN